MKQKKADQELSGDAQRILRKLPNLQFMLSRVLMFPFLSDAQKEPDEIITDITPASGSVKSYQSTPSPFNSYHVTVDEQNLHPETDTEPIRSEKKLCSDYENDKNLKDQSDNNEMVIVGKFGEVINENFNADFDDFGDDVQYVESQLESNSPSDGIN